MNVRLRLKELRLAAGLTQTELAHRSGIAQSRVSLIEKGTMGIEFEVLGKLADALGVDPALLVVRDTPPRKPDIARVKPSATNNCGPRPPKGVKVPHSSELVATLAIYFMRAQLMHRLFVATQREIFGDRPVSDTTVPVSNSQDFRRLAYTTYYLGTLYTVIEAWARHKMTDPSVDKLRNGNYQTYVALLKEVRNAAYHFSALDNPAVLAFAKDRPFIKWVVAITAALETYFLKSIPDYLEFLPAQTGSKRRSR